MAKRKKSPQEVLNDYAAEAAQELNKFIAARIAVMPGMTRSRLAELMGLTDYRALSRRLKGKPQLTPEELFKLFRLLNFDDFDVLAAMGYNNYAPPPAWRHTEKIEII